MVVAAVVAVTALLIIAPELIPLLAEGAATLLEGGLIPGIIHGLEFGYGIFAGLILPPVLVAGTGVIIILQETLPTTNSTSPTAPSPPLEKRMM
jgi:hypothetical protein